MPAIFDNCFANASSNIVERFVPTYLLPFSLASLARAFQRMKYAIRIVDLIQRRRPFGAVAPARSGMLRVAFELLNLTRRLVDVGEQSTRRLAVKAGRRRQQVTPLFAPGPGL